MWELPGTSANMMVTYISITSSLDLQTISLKEWNPTLGTRKYKKVQTGGGLFYTTSHVNSCIVESLKLVMKNP